MNKVLAAVIVAVTFLASSAIAETIFMRDGRVVENAKITKISADEIEYRVGEREIVYSVRKTDVAKVGYDDGTEDVFAATAAAPAPRQGGETAKSDITFGIKASFVIPSANATLYAIDGINLRSFNVSGSGIGGEAGGTVLIPFTKVVHLNAGLHLFYRNSYTLKVPGDVGLELSIRDFGISIPASIQINPNIEQIERFFVNVGLQLDIPISSIQAEKTFTARTSTETYTFRSSLDFGIRFGIGYNVNERIVLDAAFISYFTDFDEEYHGLKDTMPDLIRSNSFVTGFRQIFFSVTYFL